jgi:hypothetical protein
MQKARRRKVAAKENVSLFDWKCSACGHWRVGAVRERTIATLLSDADRAKLT